ncbi:MAG: hypothetical protein JXA36_00395 [Coriobacteriia bacterium]|nr:hypothetical protein [Coriobacteriia bacterium]
MTVIVAVIGLAVIGWTLTLGDAGGTVETQAPAEAGPVVLDERDPTPLFAREGTTSLHLMIDPQQLTALAFHQASGSAALHIDSLVPDADMALADQLKAVPPAGEDPDPSDGVWHGVCLRLWRSNRTGVPDTAADMGADYGTPVWSPVTGTVTQVRPYMLYEKYEDVEIHIRPDGREDADLVVIHVQDVLIATGDRVKGGVTQIGSVRKMSDKIEIQLSGYTTNGGDHVHMQINQVQAQGDLTGTGGS